MLLKINSVTEFCRRFKIDQLLKTIAKLLLAKKNTYRGQIFMYTKLFSFTMFDMNPFVNRILPKTNDYNMAKKNRANDKIITH